MFLVIDPDLFGLCLSVVTHCNWGAGINVYGLVYVFGLFSGGVLCVLMCVCSTFANCVLFFALSRCSCCVRGPVGDCICCQ